MPAGAKRAIAATLHGALTLPLVGRLAHRVYDTLTRRRMSADVVKNVGPVGSKLLRGAQPGPRGFASLRERGIDTVINLRPETDWEEAVVRALGMAYHKVPVSIMGAPTFDQADQFIAIATSSASGQVFVHCFHGSDRTGALCAAYRIAADGWDVAAAIAEMRRYGFHDGYQDAKLAFVHAFAERWGHLPDDQRAAIASAGGAGFQPAI